jgi:hypothetical protein
LIELYLKIIIYFILWKIKFLIPGFFSGSIDTFVGSDDVELDGDAKNDSDSIKFM